MGLQTEDLVRDIERIGVVSGDCVALGVSLKSIGWVEGGPETLIHALQAAVGDEGTIMIPAYTRIFPLPLSRSRRGGGLRQRWGGVIPSEYVFDPARTPPVTGAVSRAMWKMPGALRSRHPAFSVVAVGRDARFLIDGHDASAPGFLPYARLVEKRGKGLFIGLGGRLVSLRHQAQVEAGLMTILPPRTGVKYRDEDGSTRLYIKKEFACTTRLAEFNEEMMRLGYLREGRIGDAQSFLVDAPAVVRHISERLKENPALNICNNYGCLWCREAERKLNLYNRIEKPSVYQRGRAVRAVTAGINSLRVRNSAWGNRAFRVLSMLVNMAEK